MNAGGAPNTCKSNEKLDFGPVDSGERLSNTWATCPLHRDSPGKPGIIPDALTSGHPEMRKAPAVKDGPAAC